MNETIFFFPAFTTAFNRMFILFILVFFFFFLNRIISRGAICSSCLERCNTLQSLSIDKRVRFVYLILWSVNVSVATETITTMTYDTVTSSKLCLQQWLNLKSHTPNRLVVSLIRQFNLLRFNSTLSILKYINTVLINCKNWCIKVKLRAR